MENLPYLDIVANGHNFFKPTDTTRVANSPRLGVGPGFDSQGCVTFLSQILLSQLVLNPLGYTGWSDSAIHSNNQVQKKVEFVHNSIFHDSVKSTSVFYVMIQKL